jgi:hypothetical protein
MGTGVGEAMLIGAAVGGGSSALMGGDPIKGAMIGAAGGGLGAGFGAAAGGASGTAAGGTSGAAGGGFGGITGGTAGGTTGATFGSLGAGTGSGIGISAGAAPGAVGGSTLGGTLGGTSGSLGAGSSVLASSANPSLYGSSIGALGGSTGAAGGAGIGAGTSMVSPSTMSLATSAGPGNFTGFAPALSNTNLGFIAGTGALSGMMDAERDKFGIPAQEDYKSSFDMAKFKRSEPTYAPGSVYVPEYRDYKTAAEGGIMKLASGGPVERMSQMNTAINPQGGLYPQGMIDKTQYASPTQRPTSMELLDTEPAYQKSNPLVGVAGMNEGGIAEILESAKAQGLSPEMYQNIYGRGNRIVAMQKALKEGKMVDGVGGMASGGISSLGGYSDGGRMLKGPGDGMSDSIPGVIAGRQPARLADGEFVVPADVVSHLGNGSTDAGAKRLYGMMDKVRKARTGKKKQAPAVKADKYMPA